MLNQNQPNNETFISLNYPELRVDNLQITKDDLGKKSIQSNFIGKPNEPNVIYSKTDIPQKYQAKHLYILGKLHKDLDIDYDGELIIKNQSQTTQQTVYTIFLLKTNTLMQSLVKSIINQSNQLNDPETLTSLAINDMIDLTKPTKYIVYSSANTTIIINTNVINVGFDLKDYSTNSYSTNIPMPDLLINTKMNTNKSIVEMNNQDQAVNKSYNKSYEGFSLDKDGQLTNDDKKGDYMICDNLPVGSKEELSYLIPGNSAVVDSITSNSAFNSMMYMVICFCLFLAIYWLSPIGYMLLFTNLPEVLKKIYSQTVMFEKIEFANITVAPNTQRFNLQMFHTPFELIIAIIVGILLIILVSVGLAPATKSAPTVAAGLLIGFCYLIGLLSARNNTEVHDMLIKHAIDSSSNNIIAGYLF
jgi:hypothetical protein